MKKIEISCKSFQRNLTKKMDSGNKNQEAIYCEDDGEYRESCDICDILCIERFYGKHLKSQSCNNSIRKDNN